MRARGGGIWRPSGAAGLPGGACANAGELAECALACEEAEAIAAAAGVTLAPYWSFVLLAWRGDIARALEVMTPVMQTATQRGEGGVLIWAHVMMTLLYNGVGHHALALAAAQKVEIHDERLMSERLLPELVEAAARSGNRELAAAATAQLTERTHAADTDWALGTEAKARALTTDGPAVAGSLPRGHRAPQRPSCQRLPGTGAPRLWRWLRTQRRARDARDQLRSAHAAFEAMGAAGFAVRSAAELRAAGGHVSGPSAENRAGLTAREEQIARLAAEGRSNYEIGAQLFVSPRTVEYHLHKVFAKLGISARIELEAALRG